MLFLKRSKLQTRDKLLFFIKYIFSFLCVYFVFLAVDPGIVNYFNFIAYAYREGEVFVIGILFKLAFSFTFFNLYITQNKFIKVVAYAITYLTVLIYLVNYNINHSGFGIMQAKLLIGDATTRAHVLDFFYHFHKQIIGAVLYAFFIIAGLYLLLEKFSPKISKAYYSIIPAIALPALYVCVSSGGYYYTQMPIVYKVPGIMYMHFRRNSYYGDRSPVQLQANKRMQFKNIVFIVDESIRGDLLSINGFEKETTPFLKSISNKIFNYGIASSAANCSDSSNIIMQVGIKPNEIPDKVGKIFKLPSIFQYSQKAGYKTYYLSVRGRKNSYADFMTKYDFKYIDKVSYIGMEYPNVSREYRDHKLAAVIANILSRNTKHNIFIYALKEGNHFSYDKGYPKGKSYFRTDGDDQIKRIRNAYNNATRWVVDDFMKYLLNKIKNKNVIIVYTSDHGQGLYENNDPSTHCKPKNPLSVQASVPLIVIPLNQDYVKFSKLAKQNFQLNKNKVSNFNLFPTLLILEGYNEHDIKEKYGSSIFEPLSANRYFYSGDLWGKAYKNEFKLKH